MPQEENYLVWLEPEEYNKIHPGNSRKHEWVKHKGGCCQKCGYKTCVQSLTFHHINPGNKKFYLSNGSHRHKDLSRLGNDITGRSKEEIYEELDKCVLLCHNCHYELHAGLWLISEVVTPQRIKQEQLL